MRSAVEFAANNCTGGSQRQTTGVLCGCLDVLSDLVRHTAGGSAVDKFEVAHLLTSRLRHGHTEGDVGKSVRPLAHFGPQN